MSEHLITFPQMLYIHTPNHKVRTLEQIQDLKAMLWSLWERRVKTMMRLMHQFAISATIDGIAYPASVNCPVWSSI